jgi:hypothetical protein
LQDAGASSTYPFPETFLINWVSVYNIFWSGDIEYIVFTLSVGRCWQLNFPLFIPCKIERNETGDNAGNERDSNWELETRHGGFFSLKGAKIMNVDLK